MRCHYACGSQEHEVSRRLFLQGLAAGGGLLGFQGFTRAAAAAQLESEQKRVVVFYLAGGLSQLESWDPKPGTDTGGPFDKIQTSAPGVEISELLPHTAKQMHHLSIVRSINYGGKEQGDHGRSDYMTQTGRVPEPGFEFPYLGSAMARLLLPADSPLPGAVVINGGASSKEAAFLGPKYVPFGMGGSGAKPANLDRPAALTAELDQKRRALRAKLGDAFLSGRRQAATEAYSSSFEQAEKLMSRKEVFDFSSITPADEERYGKWPLGKHALMALKLVESGVPFVKVTHTNYDTHSENFNFHIEQLGEFDRPFAMFISDLADRGLLQHTLVIVMSEFGRTPRINHLVGRDHWASAWSICLGGAGIKPGVAVGKTNDNGTQVVDREVNSAHLFHTYYRAVGVDPTKSWWDEGRPIAKADPKAAAIDELLA